jgi:heme A synthase
MILFIWIYLLIGVFFAVAGANHPQIKQMREQSAEFNERITAGLIILIFVWPLAVAAAFTDRD